MTSPSSQPTGPAFCTLLNGQVIDTFDGIHELFDFAPEWAVFFLNHPGATYVEFDRNTDVWRYEKLG